MKQGNALVNFVMIALALALACYLGFYIWDGFSDPFSTTYAYEYVDTDGVEAQGFLAREEQVFSDQVGIVDVVRGEGEKVGVGQEVARVHRDSQAVAVQSQLDELSMEISLLDYALGQGDGYVSSAKLDESILQALVELRSAAAVNDYSQLEDQVVAVKSQVLQRDYTYGKDLDLADLSAQRQALVQEYQSLSAQSAGATSVIRASSAGTFSALVDGYETLLTPESIFTLTPTQLDELEQRQVTPSASSPGKLITSNRWYFVTALNEADAQRMGAGDSITVSFSGDFNQDVPMTVEQVGQAEEGRCVVVLSTSRYLEETTLLRSQSAEIIFARHSGLRVPKTALRMVTRTVTDSETKEETEVNVLGVYTVINGQAEFKSVKIVTEGTDYYVVTPATQGSRALRAGDEVIVRATDLYDGKLLEY